jgi:hypothetical protein
MPRVNLPALNKRLADLTKKITCYTGSARTLRSLQDRRILVFRQIHEETQRNREELLKHARTLSRLKTSKGLSAREAFAVQVAVELFHGVPEEEIQYAERQAVHVRH